MSDSLLGVRPLPKLGDCSRCARPAGTLAAEKYVLAGGAGQNMIPFSFPACGRGNSARRALPGESVERKGRWGPSGFLRAAARTCWVCPAGRVRWTEGLDTLKEGFPRPKPSPRGEGAPVRTLGWMRGRFGTQPFLVEKRRSIGCRLNEVFLLLRWATRSPPHPSPSVTVSPKGKPLGCAALPEKASQIRARRWAPKQPHHRNNAPQPPKPASGNERALKKGGRGASPRDSLRPGFL